MKKIETSICVCNANDYVWIKLDDLYNWCVKMFPNEKIYKKECNFLISLINKKKATQIVIDAFS